VSRRITASNGHADLTDQLISSAINSGMKAADGVREYTEPAWPMRVVEAFMSGTQEFVRSQVLMPCDPGSILCGSQPFCKRAQNDGQSIGTGMLCLAASRYRSGQSIQYKDDKL